MKYEISDSQLKKLTLHTQSLIETELNFIKEESQDWGLGEMDDIDEIESIDKIVIDRVVPYHGFKVYINIYSKTDREDYNNIRAELQYRLETYIPKIKLFINLIIGQDDLYLNEMEVVLGDLKEDYLSYKDKLNFFKRRIGELNNHIHEIVNEWYFHFDICSYKTYQEYVDEVINSSAITLINSYDELYSPNNEEFEEIITNYILNRYKKLIKQEWDERECD